MSDQPSPSAARAVGAVWLRGGRDPGSVPVHRLRTRARPGGLLKILVTILAPNLTACSGIIATGPAPNLYNLTPKSTFAANLPVVDRQVVVAEPLAAGGLDSNRIALRPTPTELKYYARARWTERAPKMVQTLLVESLENSGKIVSVGRQAIGLRSDYDLKTELREFQAEYFGTGGGDPNIRVRLNAKIIAQPRQTIIASRSFEHYYANSGSDIGSIVVAFDEALGKVLKETVEWTLVTIAGRSSQR